MVEDEFRLGLVYDDENSFTEQNFEYDLIGSVGLLIERKSGSIERFFSKTGYILRQHRRQMTNALAQNLK
ncbi:hypothetical protein BpHYR1_032092 [Brachionus plicatilis]|uniref:Uncharacterized protein n=1 Tax=Brachionus plicatilis TaxID=10195 RepID=A0A3M7T0C3_BRAPC|nr:hypothetical protein BpHYR1_032092 [Brachionus plicatilis]